MGTFRSIYRFSRSFASQIVSSVYCLSVLMSLINRSYGAGNCWHQFGGVCFKLNELNM